MGNAASVLEAARAARAEIKEKTHLDLVVPNTNGFVWGRYKAMPYVETRAIGKKHEAAITSKDARQAAEAEILLAKDTLINALIEFYYQDEDGELQPIDDSNPVRWTEIAAHLDVDLSEQQTGRWIIGQLYATEVKVLSAFVEYQTWAEGDGQEVSEELFSDSVSGT